MYSFTSFIIVGHTQQNSFWDYFFPNIFLPIAIIAIICLTTGILYLRLRHRFGNKKRKELIFKDFNVGKYAVLIMRQIGDRYHQIDNLKINIKDQNFRYENKDFKTFDTKQVAYSDKRNNYYAFDFDTGEQLTFKTKGMPNKITIEDVDIYVNRKLIEQLVAGLEEKKQKGQWILLIAGLALGIGVGIIIGLYAIPHSSKLIFGQLGVFI